jgi:hypothetical protein
VRPSRFILAVRLEAGKAAARSEFSRRINERSNELIAEGRKVFKLGLGQSPFPVPGPVQPGRVIARFGQSLALNGWSRASPRGVAYNAGGHSPSPVRTLPIR